MVKVSILEETPGELNPFIELYCQNVAAFTTINFINIVETDVANSNAVAF
jgi:hypothetical protein